MPPGRMSPEAEAEGQPVIAVKDEQKAEADKMVKGAGKTEPDDPEESAAFNWGYRHRSNPGQP